MSNKFILAIIASIIALPTGAIAGHIDDMPLEVPVTIPEQRGEWSFGLTGLYIKRTNNDFHYATLGVYDDGVIDQKNNQSLFVDHDFDWGAIFEVDYAFIGHGRFVHFAWEHLDSSARDTQSNAPNFYLVGPFVVGTGNTPTALPQAFVPYNIVTADQWESIQGKSEINYDAADLVFGQRLKVAERVEIAPFGGIRYASVDSHNTINAMATDSGQSQGEPDNAVGLLKQTSSYSGLGPRVGANAMVILTEYFSVRAGLGATLLVGSLDNKYSAQINYTENGTTLEGSFYAVSRTDARTRVVPELDAHLAIAFNDNYGADTSFGIEVGFRGESYFGAEDTSQYSYIDTAQHSNDFSYYGPYLRIEFRVT